MAAAFTKRLARLALTAPPAGAVVCLRSVYNLIRRHPKAKVLIHRAANDAGEVQQYATDPYNMDEPDPERSGALKSCVWEVCTLKAHWHPTVARAARLLEIPRLSKPELRLDGALRSSYASLFEADVNPRHVGESGVTLTFTPPERVLDGDAFADLWQLVAA